MALNEDRYPLTKEAYKKFKKEIEAWANGEQIQFKLAEEFYWTDIKEGLDPQWIISVDYRIKPKPTYVPFTFNDRDRFRGQWLRRKSDLSEFCPCEIYPKTVYFQAGNYANYETLLERFEFLDGTPCGKLENNI